MKSPFKRQKDDGKPKCSNCKSANIVTTTTKTAGEVTSKTIKCYDCGHNEKAV